MATRNRTLQYKKHRDALRSVRAPLSSSASASAVPVIEMVNAFFLRSNRSSYTPFSTEEDPALQSLLVDLRRKQCTYLKRVQQQKEGHNGIDLEMNLNKNRHRLEDTEYSDVVVKSANELSHIMKDLTVLVIDQGTIVDRIDYNIKSVATSVEGFKQLQKAERTHKKGGMVMCVTVLVILCFIMIALLNLKELFL